MKGSFFHISVIVLIIFGFLTVGLGINRVITVVSENGAVDREHCVIIDAGHGGFDGGATSCTGILESQINLEIALRLNDLLHLMGIKTVMIRSTNESVETEGGTIAAKKISDLKERVRVINSTQNAVLVSIHQNYFTEARYSGAQTFFAPTDGSRTLAEQMQSVFIKNLNPGSKRQAKKAGNVYIMQHINCPGILIECGFLSNIEEERLLRDKSYQEKISICIASAVSKHLYADNIA